MKNTIILCGAAVSVLSVFSLLFPRPPSRKSFVRSERQAELHREILESRRDLLLFLSSLLEGSGADELLLPGDIMGRTGTLLGCEDLTYVTGLQYVGSGFTKLVHKGTLRNGKEIALKSVHNEGNDVTRCVRRYGDPAGCRSLATYKLHKEVTLLRTLRHPGVITLHGHCYENSLAPNFRVTAMLELGSPLEMIQLLQTPWEKRFKICLELVNLLHYLANSPMGSIALLDFQPRQFVLVDENLKVTDIDDATMEELECNTDKDCTLEFPSRTFAVRCSRAGRCTGINEKRNLFNAYRFFFTYLLPHAAPPALQPLLLDIMNATGDLSYGINETLEAFQNVLKLYKSGMNHQRRLLYLKDYMLIEGYRLNETNDDFRCWPSYNHRGCALSVHNSEEAAEFCSKNPNCHHFVIGHQRTWTGRLMATFTSSAHKLIPDANSRVYMKKPSNLKK
ncbi:protein kinase domain containing, cytoplasmic homolog, gene 1 [Xenopus laevis]|uniref:Protein kinase domain containing, cytoplasmic homolog, gene 1 n=2 Tax=Xenopus laevis TaxID=8355 RepID=A0A8J0Q7A3_XENLA|nr:protein kinase domain containing, cytoplasmic homolog, gene 1 [Xenopus laevis]